MRITVLANQDIASNLALNFLVRALEQDQLTVFLSTQVGKRTTHPEPLQELKFFEQDMFNDILFPALGTQYSPKDKQLLSFQELQQSGVSLRTVKTINDKQGLALLAINKPHLILSIRFGLILQQEAIDIPEFGVLNLHSGILPDYRGVMATFWAMLNQEPDIGTTLHYITDSGIDTGNIISVQSNKVNYQRCYLSNVLSLYQPGVNAMVEAVESIRQGVKPAASQQTSNKGSYYSFPDEKALTEFFSKGLSLVKRDEVVDFASKYFEAEA